VPRHLKAEKDRQRRNKRAIRLVGPDKMPAPRGRWLKATIERWEAYWSSEVAKLTDPATDLDAVDRLFCLYDERERCERAIGTKLLLTGSREQIVLNPLCRHKATLDAEIRQLEDRLGKTPRARLQLGVTFGEAMKSLDALTEALQDDDEDPRIKAV